MCGVMYTSAGCQLRGKCLVADGSVRTAGKRAPAEVRHKQAGVQHEAHSVVDGLRSMSGILKRKAADDFDTGTS